MIGAYQYQSDDGNTYKVAVDSSLTTGAAGNLPVATGAEPLFPALWQVRHLRATLMFVTGGGVVRIPCDATNALYINPSGGVAHIDGDAYRIIAAIGEERLP